MSSTILIIDDDVTLREIICSELRDSGFEAITASNGKDGFELARRRLPDLILCDINMPDLDGFETLKLLRSDNLTSTIPTILMTGVMKEYPQVRYGMNIGADDYIIKPFIIPDLLATIQSRLSKQAILVKKAESKLEKLRENITLSLPHELRTPLTALIGFSELLQSGYNEIEREEIGAMAKLMLTSSHRLYRLIEEYIDYFQLEIIAKDNDLLPKMRKEVTTNIGKIVKTEADKIAEEAGRIQDMMLNIQPKTVNISETHLAKIASYLIENAFKFSQSGTTVSVRGVEQGGYYKLIIQDAGCGMSEEQLSEIGGYMQFERKKNEQQGLGLGLITAKRLTEIYGGSFTIESLKNNGTTVTVKLLIA